MINKGALTVRTNTCVLLLYMCEGAASLTETCYMLLEKKNLLIEISQSFPSSFAILWTGIDPRVTWGATPASLDS